MFYSHQLLARKTPMGQIWMAATMHAKINRRKLDKLNIIKICEEILNPSVPMALRLSGILMGGVVIVYERKVKIFYDDVSRLLIEINEAWRVKRTAKDPTVHPKNRAQAKYDTVTLPDAATNMDVDMEDPGASMSFSVANTGAKNKVPRNSYRMQLDDIDDAFININPESGDQFNHKHHQADVANITLMDDYTSGMAQTDLFNRFERFEIDGDEDMQFTVTQEGSAVPSAFVPSPPLAEQPPQAGPIPAASEGVKDHPMEDREGQQGERPMANASPPSEKTPERVIPAAGQRRYPTRRATAAHTAASEGVTGVEQQDEKPMMTESQESEKTPEQGRSLKRKANRHFAHVVFDDERLIIPGNEYQEWLKNCSDILTKRGRKIEQICPKLSAKVSDLMELPPLALISSIDPFTGEICYPPALMELWRECVRAKSPRRSPSGVTMAEQSETAPPPPPRSSPPQDVNFEEAPEFPTGNSQSDVGSQPMHGSIEKLRANLERMDFGVENTVIREQFATPKSPPGGTAMSNPSSGSGPTFLPVETEVTVASGRSRRQQQRSSSMKSFILDPVDEEATLRHNLADLDLELLVESMPTQTPPGRKSTTLSIDKTTETIRSHLKLHFDTPGAPESESVDWLATGMNRKQAARLFYQTCVLATFDFIKVRQDVPYGDISISRGANM